MKFCVDCAFYECEKFLRAGVKRETCNAPDAYDSRDPVSGEWPAPSAMREEPAACGREAFWFGPKEVSE